MRPLSAAQACGGARCVMAPHRSYARDRGRPDCHLDDRLFGVLPLDRRERSPAAGRTTRRPVTSPASF